MPPAAVATLKHCIYQLQKCRDTALSSMRGRVFCVLCRVVGCIDGLEPINSDSSWDFNRSEREGDAKGEESLQHKTTERIRQHRLLDPTTKS